MTFYSSVSQVVKDRLLDLLSREDEEESHGEDVVRVPTNSNLYQAFSRSSKWIVYIECSFTHCAQAYQALTSSYTFT